MGSQFQSRCAGHYWDVVKKEFLNTDVNLSGYNLFQQDRSSKGGGVAIFTKDHLQCSVVSTTSVPKQFDLLVLSIKLSKSSLLTFAGCYCPPSEPALYTKSEYILPSDWDMLKPPDQVLKQWDSLNLSDYHQSHKVWLQTPRKGYSPRRYPHK